MIYRLLLLSCILWVSLLGLGIQAQAEYLLDGFDSANPSDGWSLMGESKIETGINVVGGSRITFMSGGTAPGSIDLFLWPNFNDYGTNGVLKLNIDTYAGAAFSLIYDGNDMDFTPVSTFTIGLVPDHYGYDRATIFRTTLTDNQYQTSSITRIYPTYLSINAFREEVFNIADFTGTADLTNIISFQFDYVGDYANDVFFDYIKTNVAPVMLTTNAPPVSLPGSSGAVPLPSAVLLLGAGLGRLFIYKRNKGRER